METIEIFEELQPRSVGSMGRVWLYSILCLTICMATAYSFQFGTANGCSGWLSAASGAMTARGHQASHVSITGKIFRAFCVDHHAGHTN